MLTPPSSPRFRGFTLIEMLVSITLLILLSAVLLSISGAAGKMWTQEEGHTQHREKARSAIDYMTRDLSLATLGVNPNGTHFRFVVNPSTASAFGNHDSIFWLAPVATSPVGGMAEVGYFVRFNTTARANEADLCRFFVNPTDTGNYDIYSGNSGGWPSSSIVNTIAPATASNPGAPASATDYKGLFLENVAGLWVECFDAGGAVIQGGTSGVDSFDTSVNTPKNILPAKVQISLVMLDNVAAARMKSGNLGGDISQLSSSCTSAAQFIDKINTPASAVPWAKGHVSSQSFAVYLNRFQ